MVWLFLYFVWGVVCVCVKAYHEESKKDMQISLNKMVYLILIHTHVYSGGKTKAMAESIKKHP